MINILCPTDFSANSEFAIEYAINISNALKAKLHFVSSYSVPYMSGRMGSIGDKIEAIQHEEMDLFLNKFKAHVTTGFELKTDIIVGTTAEAILNFASRNDIQLIIMGTKGSSSLVGMFLGSFTKSIFEKSTIPVLAIPASFRSIATSNKILLSLDVKGIGNLKAIDVLKQLKQLPDTSVDVFHVAKNEDEKIAFSGNTSMLSGVIENIIVVNGTDPVMEIKHYVDENEIGILAMVGRQHSFWERLLMESNTTAELFATNVPILLLPE